MSLQRSKRCNNKTGIFIVILIIMFTICLQLEVYALKKEYYEKNWIKNSDFSLSDANWLTSIDGDESDTNITFHSEQGNFEIYGEARSFSLIADPPLVLDWLEMDNPEIPDRPDLDEITPYGCRVSHEYNDTTAVQNPSVHWDQNITMPVNMTDYAIKSASIQAIVNATVDRNLDRLEDYLTGDLARLNPNYIVDTYSVGDYIRFYILISDIEKNKVYEIAAFQTELIGSYNPPGKEYLSDTYMISVPQEELIFFLESVLKTDKYNFTLSLGIKINCEDNLADYWDIDTFDELFIKFVNLTFTYEKKIDRYTSVSMYQIGESINGTRVEITDAVLNFKFKINDTWPVLLSPNSELKIFINNFEIEKTIKLGDINTTFHTIIFGANDIKSYIFENVNISVSIMILLADEFMLARKIVISIDDVYLTLSYTVFIDSSSNNDIILIILTILLIIIAILGGLSAKSYIFLPRKLKKRNNLLLRTQKFKDAENIQGVLLIHNTSGLPLFTKNYSDMMEGKNTLFSGFIQAISLVGEEISLKKHSRSKGIRKDLIDGIHDIVELDFKHFYCLISDIEELRTVLILSNKASKRLKQQLLNFGLSFYTKHSEKIKKWDNDLDIFKEITPSYLNNYFNLYYKDFFKLAIKRSDLESIKKEYKLSRNDIRVLNEIFAISKEDNIFKLITLLEKSSEKNEDLIIDSIEILIKNKLVNSINPMNFQY